MRAKPLSTSHSACHTAEREETAPSSRSIVPATSFIWRVGVFSKRVTRWLDNGWVGDFLGVVCLFGGFYVWLFVGWLVSP